ncbi:FG-GAP repeat domain-containing protein [Agrilutibacter solisilvae]|uniref:VCBS repeat-containing protein n=1 Tax=Agrilutibacter solisilvae TaxID=2763317 RepID=A0A974Y4N0_9GAMM|nr:VCBS repeat-containing protein [Lysobacter solisilvae]QSX77926.1 VCBS repeat-containing protein [Lysobacter solisilvae]
MAAAVPVAAHAGAFMFGPPVQVWDKSTSAVAVADFNGDGRDDVAVVGMQLYVDVLLQQADGTLLRTHRLSSPVTVFDLGVADLGKDGTRELLVGHARGLSTYKWNGANGFTLKEHAATYACQAIGTADLQGDGLEDVVCVGDAEAMLYYGAMATGLSAPSYMQVATVGRPRLRDVTGDGKPDLLLANGTSNSFFVYAHDGNRGFLPAVAYTYPKDYAWSQDIEVVDHASAREVIVAASCNTPCATLYKYRRAPNGYFELAEQLPTFDNPHAMLATDVDEDGRQDLLVGHRGWMTIGRYMGLGQRLSPAELWTPLHVKYPDHMAIGDLNHDGHADLAVSDGLLHIHYGGRQPVSDFNGDFVSDVAWTNEAGQNMLWLSANSASTRTLDAQDGNWSLQAVGDFDGDGSADSFWRNRVTGANEVWSAGQARLTATTSIASQDWQVVGAGDFDGDSRADLLWRNARTGANTIWKSATSETYQALAVADLGLKVAGIGDFTGDGRSDILWRHATTGANVVWPSSRQDLQQALTSVASQQWQVAGVGDFNGDGTDDLVWRNSATGANELWLSGLSARRVLIAAVPVHTTLAAVGDYNGDGRADLMWRNASTGENVIWRSADKNQLQPVGSLVGWKVVR